MFLELVLDEVYCGTHHISVIIKNLERTLHLGRMLFLQNKTLLHQSLTLLACLCESPGKVSAKILLIILNVIICGFFTCVIFYFVSFPNAQPTNDNIPPFFTQMMIIIIVANGNTLTSLFLVMSQE